MDEDIETCHCNWIMRSEIIKAIKEKGLKTAD
jgi:NAD(P)H-nitrite reductase large subunit